MHHRQEYHQQPAPIFTPLIPINQAAIPYMVPVYNTHYPTGPSPIRDQQNGFYAATPQAVPAGRQLPVHSPDHRRIPDERVNQARQFEDSFGYLNMNCPSGTGRPQDSYKFKLEIPKIDRNINSTHGQVIINKLGAEEEEGMEFREKGCVSQIQYALKITDTAQNAFNRILDVARTPFTPNGPQTPSQPFFLKISDDKMLYKGLVSCQQCKVDSIKFGTLLPNLQFLNHWTVSYELENRASDWGDWMNGHFKANFLFDDSRLLYIDVWNYTHPNNNGKKEILECLEHFTVSVNRKQLQRLIVQQTGSQVVFYMELAYPARICKRNVAIPRNRVITNMADPDHRFETVYRGRHSTQYPGNGVLAENRFVRVEFSGIDRPSLYVLLSRIYARTKVPIEMGSIPVVSDILIAEKIACPYIGHGQYFQEPIFDNELRSALPDEQQRFELVYLLRALVSLGAIVKDQILLDGFVYGQFVQKVVGYVRDSFEDCMKVLEALYRFLTTRKKHADILSILDTFHQALVEGDISILPLDYRLASSHFEKIGVIVLTPTRVIIKPCEIHMGNTVTRLLGDYTKMLRILVREDDGTPLRGNLHGEQRVREIVANRMSEGIQIYGRNFKFFGSSGSQQREMGMYFMNQQDIASTWAFLGNFEHERNMYKRLAREGQNLTQSMRCGILIQRDKWRMVPDYKGGRKGNGGEFCFSDGCGMISPSLMKKIFNDLKMDNVPCAFQFRFLGFKGMLAVNPDLEGDCVLFRLSQCKFGGREEGFIEMVKAAGPQTTNMSKPLFNILCQNSASHGEASHKRILNRIMDLYEKLFMSLALAMVDEQKFRSVLKDLPYFMDVDFLSREIGFVLHQEDFFRSLVRAFVKQKLGQQINKISLPLPADIARSMFGVVDETRRSKNPKITEGILRPGQIFVQWSTNLRDKYRKNTSRKVVEGKVLVTKNPCLASGDVRVYEAVNHPELARRYCDVIVFPNYGDRPEPDKMAGSDLDGDEYTVICDQELLLDRNEEPFDFESNVTLQPNPEWERLDEEKKKIEHVLDFFQKNKIGVFADAQMNASDIYGINSVVCKRLIKKTCAALDFAKSGVPPADLTSKWERDSATGEDVPPEKCSFRPDFKRREECGPTYASSRITGIIHRSNRQLSSLLTTDEPVTTIKMNPVLVEAYKQESRRIGKKTLEDMETRVMKELNTYNSRIKGIRDNYGIMTEGELFSGCVLQMLNKLCEREEDDGSNFTTTSVVQRLIEGLFKEQRKRFFEEEPEDMNWFHKTEYRGKYDEWESENVLKRTVKAVSSEMRLKALMYYNLAYKRAIETGDQLLSFGWVAWDVLAKSQEWFNGNHPDFNVPRESFHETLENKIMEYRQENSRAYTRFLALVRSYPSLQNLHDGYGEKVVSVLFVLKEWADRCGLITTQLPDIKFLMLLVFASSRWPSDNGQSDALFEVWNRANMDSNRVHSGQLIAKLMERLASRSLLTLGPRSERELGVNGLLTPGDWKAVHEVARKSFYALCIHQKLDELVGIPGHMESIEREVMILELPGNLNTASLDAVARKLLEKTGAEEITLRTCKEFKSSQNVTVLYRANAEAEERLRRLVQLELQSEDGSPRRNVTQKYSVRVHRSIME